MSELTAEPTDNLSQEEIKEAEQAEQAQLNAQQNQYLLKRIVLLRIRANKLQRQLDEAREELETLRPPAEAGSDVETPSD